MSRCGWYEVSFCRQTESKKAGKEALHPELLSIAGLVNNQSDRAPNQKKELKSNSHAMDSRIEKIKYFQRQTLSAMKQTAWRVITGEKVENTPNIVSMLERHTENIMRDTQYGHKINLSGEHRGFYYTHINRGRKPLRQRVGDTNAKHT